MIFYNDWFSYKPDTDEIAEIDKVRRFLESHRAASRIHSYRLLINDGKPPKSRLPPYQAVIAFMDDRQFGLPFAEVSRIGIHSGLHGIMIENVKDFVVELFRDVSCGDPIRIPDAIEPEPSRG